MARTSAFRLRIRTDSSDSNGLLLLVDGELVAILVELMDECHGAARGHWVIESIFGMNTGRRAGVFPSAEEAAKWISGEIHSERFQLSDLIQLA